MLPFTNREIETAWWENLKASETETRKNPHRLLLFYAVECGLKAVIMRRERLKRTDKNPVITQFGHDINKLLQHLDTNKRLTEEIKMVPIPASKKYNDDRPVKSKDLNQMWRYGGKAEGEVSDTEIEKQLLKIVEWIKKELQG